MTISKGEVEQFFERYAQAFRDGLEGTLDEEFFRSLFSTQYIAAGPKGVMAGDNDHTFVERISKGYEHYRQIGNKAVTVSGIEMHSIDETHCLVHVGWSSEFEKDGRRIDVPFTNVYLLEQNDGMLKVFGWITGDEVQLLKDNGLL
ncbi:nuclear transport factor 2 family protein [Bradyrhizobium sp. 191]|uniref:nuclear transport factor 2 family protein n=1 Tax=Bradyrhizobium sp. 191 TaxID=2782659 RepID=UPI001FFEE172|nr:nuclear transport factor 2 family protein [Bradyrhizobium sp. 191]UPJ66547.1 nuclear transport factor 2 family protein [Bradyrhizobium sp. 191]